MMMAMHSLLRRLRAIRLPFPGYAVDLAEGSGDPILYEFRWRAIRCADRFAQSPALDGKIVVRNIRDYEIIHVGRA